MRDDDENSANKIKVSIGAKLSAFFLTLIIGSTFVDWDILQNWHNESSAAYFINSIKKKQIDYASNHQGRFASNFIELDNSLTNGTIFLNGYTFSMKTTPPTGTKPAFYSINADPQTYLYFFKSGTRRFYFDSTLATTKVTEENRQAIAKDPTL